MSVNISLWYEDVSLGVDIQSARCPCVSSSHKADVRFTWSMLVTGSVAFSFWSDSYPSIRLVWLSELVNARSHKLHKGVFLCVSAILNGVGLGFSGEFSLL